MKENKIYIILLLIIVVFGLIMFLLFGLDNIKQDSYQAVVIVGEETTWAYNDRNWINLSTKQAKEKLNWETFKVYEGAKEKGDYYLWHDDKWYVFDKEKNAVNMEENFIATQSNYEISIKEFKEEEVGEMKYINEVLKENNLSTSSKFTSIYKVNFDFDKDNQEEEFYIITNAFPFDFDPDKIFSIAFMVKSDIIYPIYTDISLNKGLNGCKPYYNTFLDVDNDNTYELILSCGKYSTTGRTDMLYKFKENNFKILISNQ